MTAQNDIFACLRDLGISYERADHQRVFTCDEARRLASPLPGAHTKNLLVRDKKGVRYFMIVTSDEKDLDLNALSQQQALPRLSFASPERLQKVLGISPGAVSPLALINDREHQVELLIDECLKSADRLQCHPLDNAVTLSIAMGDLQKFFAATGHEPRFLPMPVKSQ